MIYYLFFGWFKFFADDSDHYYETLSTLYNKRHSTQLIERTSSRRNSGRQDPLNTSQRNRQHSASAHVLGSANAPNFTDSYDSFDTDNEEHFEPDNEHLKTVICLKTVIVFACKINYEFFFCRPKIVALKFAM